MTPQENKDWTIEELKTQFNIHYYFLYQTMHLHVGQFNRYLNCVRVMPVDLFIVRPTVIIVQRGFAWSTTEAYSVLAQRRQDFLQCPAVKIPTRYQGGGACDIEVVGMFKISPEYDYKKTTRFLGPRNEREWEQAAMGITTAMFELL